VRLTRSASTPGDSLTAAPSSGASAERSSDIVLGRGDDLLRALSREICAC
jgi:hypothetical protein